MYIVKTELEISAAHKLNLPYESPCNRFHGHNYKITVHCNCRDDELVNGMVVDFAHIKKTIKDMFDHDCLNDIMDHSINPTAENLAKQICGMIPRCYQVDVQETTGNTATYIKE